MTAHVAEAGEARGRVILRLGACTPNEIAISAALEIARAFQSEVETLFVEDSQTVDFAGFAFAREIPLRGGHPRPVTPGAMHAGFRCAFAAARRRIMLAAARADVRVYENTVRDEPVQALASACARKGPWNVIALAETFGTIASSTIEEVFDTVQDATGVILVGPNARAMSGPIVVAVDDTQHLPAMLRTAERMAEAGGSRILLLLVAEDHTALNQMEGEVRLLLGERDDVDIVFADLSYGETAVVAEAIRRVEGHFLIARFGGHIVPRNGRLGPLLASLRCPLFLVR